MVLVRPHRLGNPNTLLAASLASLRLERGSPDLQFGHRNQLGLRDLAIRRKGDHRAPSRYRPHHRRSNPHKSNVAVNPDTTHYVALALSILLVPVAQIMLKLGVRNAKGKPAKRLTSQTLTGLGVLLAVTVLSAYAFRMLEVKTVTAWSSLIYLLVALLSRFVLQENLTRRRLAGCVMIATGILLFQFGP